jgi:arylsulfatase A-like enzyme
MVVGKRALGDPNHEASMREMRRRKPAPHLIVFSIDNVQADRVGAYGYRKNPSTTNIDRLARQGVVFEHAYTLYPGTRVFMTSMLTGRRMPSFKQHQMPQEFQEESLPVMLKRRDYHTLVKGVFELTSSRRFDPDDYEIDTNLRRATAEEIRESGTIPHIPIEERFAQIEEHLREAQELKRPVLIWLHMLQPHRFRGKFVPTKGFDFGKSLDGLYDSAIAGPDALIVRLEKLLEKHLSDDRETIWVIMSDHGTGMSRGNKQDTGKTLYNDHVHVPLIIKGGGITPGRLPGPIDSAVDISATLLDLAGIEPPPNYDGTSLVPLLERRSNPDVLADRFIALQSGSWRGAIQGRFKLIARKKSHSQYDLKADPQEKKNIADENPALVESMKERMEAEQKRMSQAYFGGLEK